MDLKLLHLLVLVSISGSLVGCFPQSKNKYPTTIAERAVTWTQQIVSEKTQSSAIRGSALIGVYVSHHLIQEVMFRSALAGISAQAAILLESTQEQEQSFALLETLGAILQVDVPDMLNRSPIRSAAFDTYVSNLQNIGNRTNAEIQGLDAEMKILSAMRRTQRSDTAKSQSELNRAIRSGDFTTASDVQKRLVEQEGVLAITEAQLDRIRSITNILENMMDVAEKRLSLLAANRAAILAGVKVTDLPGAEDLGILEQGKTFRRSGRSLFDPETLN